MLPKRYIVYKNTRWFKLLPQDFVFVFGSNQRGAHGAGAAKAAQLYFGARYGCGFGPMGQSFAIPTKDTKLNVLDLDTIKRFVDKFLDHARANPSKVFLVTPIGTGLAGYDPSQIAPMFTDCPINVVLPIQWVSHLPKDSRFILSPI